MRLIGVIEADQTEGGKMERNDRLLAVASHSVLHQSTRRLTDVSRDLQHQIEHFFLSYNAAKGKTFRPKRRSGPERARTPVLQAVTRRRRG